MIELMDTSENAQAMIPIEAVEAAIRTMPEYTPDEEADSFERETNDQCRAKVERILEAAAPHMLAAAQADALDDAAAAIARDEDARDSLTIEWLRNRAAALRSPRG